MSSPATAAVNVNANHPHHHHHTQFPRSSSEFLQLNVREVFEYTTIDKTVEIQRKLGLEIERKKEEMRVLVGERYRDLIDAADTIGTMRSNSREIHDKLIQLRTKLSTFPVLSKTSSWSSNQTNGNLRSGNDSLSDDGKRSLTSQELEIAFKLKLSQEIPRQIQLQLEKQNLTRALHYYLLYTRKVRDVLTDYKWAFLQEDQNSSALESRNAAMKKSILDACNEAMEDFETSSEKLAESIIIKNVLNSCTCEATLKEFLINRVEHCQKVLLSKDQLNTEDQLIQYISRTLLSLYQIFIDPELYNSTTKSIRQPKISTLTLGFCSSGPHSPRSIEQFNNERVFIEDPPRIGKLTELLLNLYIPPLRTLLEQSYGQGQYLHQFKSLKELMVYKNTSCGLLQVECEHLGRILFGSPLKTVWNELFLSIFQLKCQAVVQEKVESIFTSFATDNDGTYARYRQADDNFDFVSFLWRHTETATSTSGEHVNEVELLKLKCLTPNIAGLCADLEIEILSLLDDFKAIIPGNSVSTDGSMANMGNSSSAAATTLLKEYMSTAILTCFQQFLTSSNDKGLFLARLLTALFELCPTLWKVLEKSDIITLKQLFWTRNESCWNDWSEALLASFQNDLKMRIRCLDPETIIELMPIGEVFKPTPAVVASIEERNSEQQLQSEFESSIHVPIQLSHILHSLLFQLCLQLANVGPQSMPKSVRDNIRQSLGQIVIEFYDALIQGQGDDAENTEELSTTTADNAKPSLNLISAQIAIQFMFDLKFIQWFHPKLGGNGQIDGMLAKLQSFVDPFDWDMIASRLNLNLKRFLFENHLTLGLLFSEESHTFIAQNFKTKQNQAYPMSNRGLLSPLPLLPI